MAINYGSPFIRLSFFGSLYVAEKFTFTMSVKHGGVVGRPTQAQVDEVAQAAIGLMNGDPGGAVISSRAVLLGVKAARIGADGHYVDPEPTSWAAPGSGYGGVANVNPAPQIALAVTLEGANPRAAAGRGRFYLPAPSAGIGSDGRITPEAADIAGQAAATLVRKVNAAFDGPRVSIVGAATAKGRGPASQEVVDVSVGRVLDTIRSRRTSLPEERVYGGWGGVSGSF